MCSDGSLSFFIWKSSSLLYDNLFSASAYSKVILCMTLTDIEKGISFW
ncbi:unnamed protein product [Brassica rapa subsp. trilocularis]